MICLPQTIYNQLLNHLRACYPAEGCGFLAGQSNQVTSCYPVPNLFESPFAYQMEPKAQVAALFDMDQRHENLLALYHSHPGSAAQPSPEDIRQWCYPQAVMVIVSLEDERRPSLSAFQIGRSQVSNYPIMIV